VTLGNDGLVYVCDRQSDRIQVFDKQGKFVKNIWVRTGTPELPDPRGTVWWVSFSRDPQQKYMYVMDGRAEQVRILDHDLLMVPRALVPVVQSLIRDHLQPDEKGDGEERSLYADADDKESSEESRDEV